MLRIISMFTQEDNISDLWRLDVFGYYGSYYKRVLQAELKISFQETTRIQDKDRYEVLLSWKKNHPSLQDNRDIAKKKLKSSLQRDCDKKIYLMIIPILSWLEAWRLLKEYLEVESSIFHTSKKEETTKIRPFRCISKESPSLNQCLETGLNFIELIPALLHQFRERKIGVTQKHSYKLASPCRIEMFWDSCGGALTETTLLSCLWVDKQSIPFRSDDWIVY